MRRLILRSYQSPGDIVMLTAAVRDLHAACPGQFRTDVRTSADALFDNNPYITQLSEHDPGITTLEMHYPIIHQSNDRPYHFIHGYPQFLEQQLGVRIPVTQFRGDIHLSADEKRSSFPGREQGVPERYWIIVAGGKFDFTAKWWNPASFQTVVDHFRHQITFVQCGEGGHWHPRLSGVVDLVGKTTLREFVRLMYFADGVLCPVTFAMHLAAAVETPPNRQGPRPCIVVAGGREPPHWEAYPHHQFLSTVGTLACCQRGGCWKSRCQLVGDGDLKDSRDLCEQPVQVTPELRIPRCLEMITPQDVIRRIEMYFEGGALSAPNGNGKATSVTTRKLPEPQKVTSTPTSPTAPRREPISVAFYHGLGDCVYFAHLIPLYLRRGYHIQVECTPDKRILFEAAGAETMKSGAQAVHPWGYPPGATYSGHGRFWQGSKMGHNISEPPLPTIGAKDELWDEFCQSRIDIAPYLSAEARATAARWLERLPRPWVLLHSKGNTGQARKSLPDEITVEFYKSFIDRCDGTLILLDWDNRVPRLPSYRIRHLDDLGACPTDVLLALIGAADLMVGVDSGPLHLTRFTMTPTIGVWMPGHYPTTYTLPRREQLNVVLANETRAWNRYKRIPWNLVEHPGASFRGDWLADVCQRLLSPPRYLPGDPAGDVQLRQFIGDWCRGLQGNALSPYSDRNRSFDALLQEATRRFPSPVIVETGVIRAEEDWAGAGFFTYLAGAYVSRRGGKLYAVDISASHVAFARDWTAVFGEAVQLTQQDSVAFLRQFSGSIDVLYLDSLDTTEAGHAEHALREVEAALPHLHPDSLIVFDDTPWNGGAFVGKGALAVPYLLQRGWKILYGGYQVVLHRGDETNRV